MLVVYRKSTEFVPWITDKKEVAEKLVRPWLEQGEKSYENPKGIEFYKDEFFYGTDYEVGKVRKR